MITSDSSLARSLAEEAGRILLRTRQELATASEAKRRSEGDRRSQDYLSMRLAAARPLDAVLSEEAVDDQTRLHADRVWIIDPLDGTREFSEPGRSDWAVHVALWVRGILVAASVALPAQRVTLSVDSVVLAPRQAGPVRIVVSRTRPPAMAGFVASEIGGELIQMGSAGAKAAAIIQGAADVYLHAGGQHEWDSAAPVALAQAAGLHASRVDGSLLSYNQPDPRIHDLVISRPDLTSRVMAAARKWALMEGKRL